MLSFSKLPTPGVLWALSAPLNAGQGRNDPRATAPVPHPRLQAPFLKALQDPSPPPKETTLCPHLGQRRWEEASPPWVKVYSAQRQPQMQVTWNWTKSLESLHGKTNVQELSKNLKNEKGLGGICLLGSKERLQKKEMTEAEASGSRHGGSAGHLCHGDHWACPLSRCIQKLRWPEDQSAKEASKTVRILQRLEECLENSGAKKVFKRQNKNLTHLASEKFVTSTLQKTQ